MNETIAAIATPFGPGAIALIRLSGEESLSVAGKALGMDCEQQEARRVTRAAVRSSAGDVIDVSIPLGRSDNGKVEEDKTYSGKYLVAGCSHVWQKDGVSTTLQLTRDSVRV